MKTKYSFLKKYGRQALYILGCTICMTMASCDDFMDPAIENNLGEDYMLQNASYADGVLGNAYTRIPTNSFPFSEVATDDAVTNDVTNSWRKIAAGSWTSDNNPADAWTNCRAAIMYINLFLSKADQVHWADDSIASEMYRHREKAEAFGLRALYMYYLLRAHGGYDDEGNLLGVPIVTTPEDAENVTDQTRATFADCMTALYADCDSALAWLPTSYVDITSEDEMEENYAALGCTVNQYNRVLGSKFRGRIQGAIVEAIRAKASLLAASPAFADGSGVDYSKAADDAAVVLDRIGGTSGMDSRGFRWFANTTEIDGLANGANPKEVLWRCEKSSNNNWETDNYPPSIYGNGRINPSQNFVDAFPMANGYPITDSLSGYDSSNPYNNRDPRLAAYVVYNGSTAGVNGTTIVTAVDGDTQDALNKVSGSSTRTGYYLKKLLRQDINLNPTINSSQYHYTPRIRYTEIYLDYAEAANEAYGPTGTGSHSYSAYDVIKALRNRAGVGTSNGDAYLESIKDDQAKMRELIRNERRIELSFEGFRFWDLRRWKAPLNETVQGISISNSQSTQEVIDVETRNFKDYMYYGPIPYTEVLKYKSTLKQNAGW